MESLSLSEVSNGETVEALSRLMLFIGSSNVFSPVTLRTVDTEIDRAQALHLPDFQALNLVMSAARSVSFGPELFMVVCDMHNAKDLLERTRLADPMLAGCKLVIGFEGTQDAQSFFEMYAQDIFARNISFLPMNLNVCAFLGLLTVIGSGAHYIPPEIAAKVARKHTQAPEKVSQSVPKPTHTLARSASAESEAIQTALTPREFEVLSLAAEGCPNKVIARDLNISEHTVKLHMHRVISKLDVSNRTEAAARLHHSYDE
jgi:DNA-binding CsgD family transcriptional regulator